MVPRTNDHSKGNQGILREREETCSVELFEDGGGEGLRLRREESWVLLFEGGGEVERIFMVIQSFERELLGMNISERKSRERTDGRENRFKS